LCRDATRPQVDPLDGAIAGISRPALVLENLALRQQLAVATRGGRRPRFRDADRMFWIALRQVWSDWAASLAIVKPATVIAWHRRAYRAYWRHLSRKPGRPRTKAQLRELIAQMVNENRWGAPRIHGELLTLGFRVSERTVSRYLRACRPQRPPGTSWKTFLSNHRDVLAALDFFTVPTVTFQLLYVLLVIQHHRRKVLYVNVTPHPTSAWVRQQLREAFPFTEVPRYLLMDNDSIFSAEVDRTLAAMNLTPMRTSFQSPWQNGVAERWVGTCRRELLDHVIVLDEAHLRRLLSEFLAYYHDDRTHLALGKAPPTDAPCLRGHRPAPESSHCRVSAACITVTPGEKLREDCGWNFGERQLLAGEEHRHRNEQEDRVRGPRRHHWR
jgi:putative transposase